jgi:parallel beta-helix repeat protein
MHSRHQLRWCLIAVLAACCLVASTSAASAANRWVNDEDPNGGLYAAALGTSCNNPGYPTIQSAVTASSSGDRIHVCPGTYVEQVTIPAGTNNLLLRSVHVWAAVIKAPALMMPPQAIVRVNGALGTTILAFTISGPGGGPCGSIGYGVRVDAGGSADILGNHITRIRDTPFSGCQNGVAVLVGRQSEGQVGSARIFGNLIDTYQKNGPTVSNTGSHADISFNRILGEGPNGLNAQNGLQVSAGATADVRHNFIAGHVYTPQTFAATGILLFQPGQVTLGHNTLSSNDVGVDMFQPANGSTTSHNRVRASTFDGIALFPADGNRVTHNKTEENSGPGIGIYDSQDNVVTNNFSQRNQDSGILLDNAADNQVDANHVRENGTENGDTTDGIRVDALSAGNTLRDNHLWRNVTHDCHDDSAGAGTAGTANFWSDNHGLTSEPPGLCREDDDEESFEQVEQSTSFGWDANYAWYLDGVSVESAEYDWPAAYSIVDTTSLLQLLPQLPVRAGRPLTIPHH